MEQLEDVFEGCQKYDTDEDGAISRQELSAALAAAVPNLSEDDVVLLTNASDVNGDGVVQYGEFLDWLAATHLQGRNPTNNVAQAPAQMHQMAGPKCLRAGSFDHQLNSTMLNQAWSNEPIEIEVQEHLRDFTHPALRAFALLAEDVETGLKDTVEAEPRIYEKLAELKDGLARNHALDALEDNDSGGWSMVVKSLEAERNDVYSLLDGLGYAYQRLFRSFCEALRQETVPRPGHLRFPPLVAVSGSMRSPEWKSILPEVFWAAIALGICRLRPPELELLQGASIKVCLGEGADVHSFEGFHEVLAEKMANAKLKLTERDAGSVAKKKGNYQWVRKENDPDSRVMRLQAFMQTQRAVACGGYKLGASEVPFQGLQMLMQATQVKSYVHDASSEMLGTNPEILSPANLNLGFSHGSPSIEVAMKLAQNGWKAAAVNAASAYQAGGGCTTGGRHALEEACCMTTTLLKSITSVESVEEEHDFSLAGFRQHIPTLGCVVSPHVEVFREGSDAGYRFLPKPVLLSGIISIAMFNRNPAVHDSPLDSPSDPTVYYRQTQAKLANAVLAADELGAEVLVIADIGCGVFKNNPKLVGGCLGMAIRHNAGRLKNLQQVVISSGAPHFMNACKATAEGRDPRNEQAWLSSTDELQEALIDLASWSDEVNQKKPECRYGALCSIKTADHLSRFYHPEASKEDHAPKKIMGGFTKSPAATTRGKGGKALPSPNTWGGKQAAGGAQFAPEDDEAKVHEILTLAKDSKWPEALALLEQYPTCVNKRPDMRAYALIHYAVFQLRPKQVEQVLAAHADPKVTTKNGMTALELAKEVLREPRLNDSNRHNCQAIITILTLAAQGKDARKTLGMMKGAKTDAQPTGGAGGMLSKSRTAALHDGATVVKESVFVSCALRQDIVGEYKSFTAHNHCPAYKKVAESNGTAPIYLYCHAVPEVGWCIDFHLDDSGKPEAFLGPSTRDPCSKPFKASWQVNTKTAISEFYVRDANMYVFRKSQS